jgi:voltage-gated potassium channel Kch
VAILAVLAGVGLIALVLLDAFEAMVLPRQVSRRFRLARLFYRAAWPLWRWTTERLVHSRRREVILSAFGPLSLLALIAVWMAVLITGFGLVQMGLGTPLQTADEPRGFGTYLYLSGTTFFTLGYGDVVPLSASGRVLAVAEAGLGFGFLAVVIGYLPVLYGAFSKREHAISLLDARAGSPPSAAQALLRAARAGEPAVIGPLLAEWERWSAELLESHLSFPLLSYYRSQHGNQSWVAALAVMLDASALLLATVEGVARYQARLTFAAARHAAVDLAMVFWTPPKPPAIDRLPPERLARLRELLRQEGVSILEGPEADAKLAELRGLYEPFVAALAGFFRFELPPIFPECAGVDNWRTSAWDRKAPKLARLPETGGDHFA